MKTEFLIKGKIVEEQEIFKISTEQDVYNKLRDLGFYDLEVKELKNKGGKK
jgi:hypothetical protein